MALLVLSKQHKKNLAFLSEIDAEVGVEFAKIAVGFILNGANAKVYAAASKKLEVPTTTVQSAVEGLMYLLTEGSRRNLSEFDFNDSVMMLAFPDGLHQTLMQAYKENKDTIRRISGNLGMTLQSYRDVKWRINSQIASRSLRQQAEPQLIMKLETLDVNSNDSSILLQTDPTTLARITEQLDAALKAVKMSHYRRITRAIK